jgi:hypothetical protein
MGAAKVEPAPLITDDDDPEFPFDELHAPAASRTPTAMAPTAMLRGASLRCQILIWSPLRMLGVLSLVRMALSPIELLISG